jgi:hypothetical protein
VVLSTVIACVHLGASLSLKSRHAAALLACRRAEANYLALGQDALARPADAAQSRDAATALADVAAVIVQQAELHPPTVMGVPATTSLTSQLCGVLFPLLAVHVLPAMRDSVKALL